MIPGMLATAVAAHLLVLSPGPAPNPCHLLTAAEIASVLGDRPSGGSPSDPKVDEDTGATATSCALEVGSTMLWIELAEFDTPAGVEDALTMLVEMEPEHGEHAKMTPQPGPGDRALWGATPEGPIWIAQKGRYMLSLTLAGELGDAGRYREPLVRLLASALGRL